MQAVSLKAKVAMWVVTLMAVGYSIIEVDGVRDHIRDSGWPHHAEFHVLTGLINLIAAFVASIVLNWCYVRRGDRIAWGTVLFIGVAIFGGAVLADPLTEHGLREGETALVSGPMAYASGWIALVVWVVAMLVAFPRSRRTPESS